MSGPKEVRRKESSSVEAPKLTKAQEMLRTLSEKTARVADARLKDTIRAGADKLKGRASPKSDSPIPKEIRVASQKPPSSGSFKAKKGA